MTNTSKLITDFYKVISSLNKKKGQWSFFTSIEYMLESKLYRDSLVKDSCLVAKYVKNDATKILDFGTGSGIFAFLLRKQNSKVGIYGLDTYNDKSQTDPNFKDVVSEQKLVWNELETNNKIQFSRYNGVKIPFPDQSFDIVTAYAVIEHMPPEDLVDVLKELRRILKRNGLLFIFKTPRKMAYSEYLASILGFGHHELLYSDAEIKKIFVRHDFKVVRHWRTVILVEFPGKITNCLYPLFKGLDFILCHSPFSIFAHHNNFILKKE